MQDVPHSPLTIPRRVNSITQLTTMGVTYDILTGLATGGTLITSYNLDIDSTGAGSGPWVEVGGFTTNSLLT
jgi:hypothetical protein